MNTNRHEWKRAEDDKKSSCSFVFIGGWSFFLFLTICFCGCRQEMYDQPRYKPLAKSEFFTNESSARPIPAHTVARGQLHDDTFFYTAMRGTNLVDSFPFPVTLAVLKRGQERYDIYCAVCHGPTGEGNGMIVQHGFPAPPSYHIDRLRNAPVGHFFDVITHGYGVMYSYATRVEPADRWAIAAYIRALQLSENATTNDLPPTELSKLEEAK
jgi:hypothetical protein